jgi:hypothetical protein
MNHQPLVVNYLQNHSLAQLKQEHGIKTSANVGETVFSLNYDQIESKPTSIVNQCRGLILSTNGNPLTEDQILGNAPIGNTYVLARPFDRFFNLGIGFL